ncbi:SDR family oxidoreductase [Candidatus Woesearchaeota archaeon]|nr:SDR family oxidoreductase [Candidatus Woesearchaeota archaeon]
MKGNVAIVTGARQGIGKGIALALAKEGCNVVVSDLVVDDCQKVVDEIKQLGADALAVKCDVSNKSEVDAMVKSAIEKFGKIDVLVNNAGIFPFKPFMDMAEQDWDKVLSVNLKSVYLCSQAAAKEMKNGGRIVNISSIASLIGFPQLAHYCASKGGINGLTRALSLELAPKIRVNAVAPGAIDTPGASAGANPQVLEQTVAATPLKRMGRPEDIANAVVFLASEKSDFVTGAVLVVDGGMTVQ